MRIAVVGATGLVGGVMLQVLEEQNFPVTELIPVASANSAGKQIRFRDKNYTVCTPEDALLLKPQIALFSAGGNTSLEWAPAFAGIGCVVIDNSSAWRRHADVPLVVPEVNGDVLRSEHKIIANPNCSTVELTQVLDPIEKAFGLKRVVVSTYQSVTGSGVKGVSQLQNEQKGISGDMAYPHPIHLNVIPHGGTFDDNLYTSEENKLIFETRKILRLPELRITCTVVRVPVYGGHSESVNIELNKDFTTEQIRQLLAETPGIIVQDDPENAVYPMPLYAGGKDATFVGRIRRDESVDFGLNLWVVSDNLRKGAATNAVQIAQWLTAHHLL